MDKRIAKRIAKKIAKKIAKIIAKKKLLLVVVYYLFPVQVIHSYFKQTESMQVFSWLVGGNG
jgi:hypothetical protein